MEKEKDDFFFSWGLEVINLFQSPFLKHFLKAQISHPLGYLKLDFGRYARYTYRAL